MKTFFLLLFSLFLIACNLNGTTQDQQDVVDTTVVDLDTISTDTFSEIKPVDTVKTTPPKVEIKEEWGIDCLTCPWPEINEPKRNYHGSYDVMFIARNCNCCKMTHTQLESVDSLIIAANMMDFKNKIRRLENPDCQVQDLKFKVYFGTILDFEK